MITSWIFGVAAVVCAALLTFSATPAVRVLAYRLNAVDRPHPRDRRRMHRRAVPRIGGLAMFFAFLIVTVAFCDVSPLLASLLLGGMVLVVLGVLDDIFSLKAWVKALVQLAVSFIPILFGLRINFFSWFGGQVQLNVVPRLQKDGRPLPQALTDGPIGGLPEVTALGMLQMGPPRNERDGHIRNGRAGQHTQMGLFHEVGENEPLPVQVQLILVHRRSNGQAAPPLGRL